MKRHLQFCLFLAFLSPTVIFALPSASKTIFDRSTTGGKTITANMTAVSGRRIVVDSVYGMSDLSTSVYTFQESADGLTYTTKAVYGCGATSSKLGSDSIEPVIAGKISYAYRILLNSTATTGANSLIINYHEE